MGCKQQATVPASECSETSTDSSSPDTIQDQWGNAAMAEDWLGEGQEDAGVWVESEAFTGRVDAATYDDGEAAGAKAKAHAGKLRAAYGGLAVAPCTPPSFSSACTRRTKSSSIRWAGPRPR